MSTDLFTYVFSNVFTISRITDCDP